MEDAALTLCLHYLNTAEGLMVESADGWHLARLSHVMEGLKEAYVSRSCPTVSEPLTVE